MKRSIYTLALVLVTAFATQAQAPEIIKETSEEVADFLLLPYDLIVYTKKEANGQFLYTERRGSAEVGVRDPVLNIGVINAVVGMSMTGDQLYVYHKRDRKREEIAIYNWNGTSFQKIGEKSVPYIQNHSYNLSMFLSPGKSQLLLSADLGKGQGYDDLYQSKWEGGRWVKPQSMDRLNTRREEFGPFVSDDTLFFARKEGDKSNVYSVPVNGAYQLTGDPMPLRSRVNQEGAFTFAYRKVGKQETWISRPAGGRSYRFYVVGAPARPVLVIRSTAKPDTVTSVPVITDSATVANTIAIPTTTETKTSLATGLALTIQFSFNEVYLTMVQREKLENLVEKLPEGTTIKLRGFSDNLGPIRGRQRVSWQRADFTGKFLKRYYAHKRFNILFENVVLEEKGVQGMKTEVHIIK